MEVTRKVINTIFIVLVVVAGITLAVLLIGGAFPININPSGQKIKFDIAYYGWEVNNPAYGEFKIIHDEGHFREGFGGLKYTYNYKGKYPPGFHSTAYALEGLTKMSFWMKSLKPTLWQVQIKRKSDNKIYHRTFEVSTKWNLYSLHQNDFRVETAKKYPFSQTDIQPWMNWIDLTNKKRYNKNIIWLDDISILR